MPPKLLDKPYAALSSTHARTPLLRRLPLPSLLIIAAVAIVNGAVWAAAGVVLHFSPALTGTAVLAYTLGLRHALDADHISAIDLMTRRLVAEGKVGGYTVGMWFSLGHSTIVIITSLVVAGTAAAVSSRFDSFSRVGGIIGTSVSAAFLIILGLINAYILYKLVREMQRLLRTPSASAPAPAARTNDNGNDNVNRDNSDNQDHHNNINNPDHNNNSSNTTTAPAQPITQQPFQIHGGGCLFHLFRRLFALIDRPWKMYPLGILFGLGFDTSSEVALLGIASIQASRGTSIWFILIFPLLFTAGMCLLDTVDGALMLALYTGTGFARDAVAVLYYSVVLTGITVAVACVIGVVQLLTLVLNVAEPEGGFWRGVEAVGEHYDVVGGAICASFVVFGGLSVVLYRPWRNWVDRGRMEDVLRREGRDEEGGVVVGREGEGRRIGEGGESLEEARATATHGGGGELDAEPLGRENVRPSKANMAAGSEV